MANLATLDHGAGALMEQVILHNDVAKMQPADRVNYVVKVCESLGLNPLTQPFKLIVLNGSLKLYATKDCTEQLRRVHGISLAIVQRETVSDIFIVTARATDKGGRSDESIGAVTIAGLKGEALANALMKAETKAKRRATLSICGLGMIDESETETVPGAQFVDLSPNGEVVGMPALEPKAKAEPKPELSAADKQVIAIKVAFLEMQKESNPTGDPAENKREAARLFAAWENGREQIVILREWSDVLGECDNSATAAALSLANAIYEREALEAQEVI